MASEEEYRDARGELASSAAMWNQASLRLADAKQQEAEAKARFEAALARIDQMIRNV